LPAPIKTADTSVAKEFEAADINRDDSLSFDEWSRVPGRSFIDPVPTGLAAGEAVIGNEKRRDERLWATLPRHPFVAEILATWLTTRLLSSAAPKIKQPVETLWPGTWFKNAAEIFGRSSLYLAGRSREDRRRTRPANGK